MSDSNGPARGIDVSVYQGNVDWAQVKAAGIGFAFAKSSEGTGLTDPSFQQNWAGMQAAGLIRGAYHFFHPKFDPLAQAQLFCKVVPLGPNDLPLALDVEVDDGLRAAEIVNSVQQCLGEIERLIHRRPIVYTGGWFWTPLLQQLGSVPGWVANYDVWIAEYSNGSQPTLPPGFNGWKFWQYSASGRLDGIAGGGADVDEDMFNGTLQDLIAYVGGQPQPQPKPVAPDGKTHLTGTNQDVINLFSDVFGVDFWNKVTAAGLTALAIPSSNRNLPYTGPAVEDLPNLSDQDKLQLKSMAVGAQG